jgi:hypothetical protein
VGKPTKAKTDRKARPVGIAKVLKRLHYPLDVILPGVRWYVTYSLSLRNLEEKLQFRPMSAPILPPHPYRDKTAGTGREYASDCDES